MASIEVKSAVIGGIVGAIATGVVTLVINRVDPQPATFVIDGNRVVVTETDYASLVDENARLQNELDEREAKRSATETIRAATEHWESGDWDGALRLLKASGSESSDVTSLFREYSRQYVDHVLEEADELVAERAYSDARKLLKSAVAVVVDPSPLQKRIQQLEDKDPVALNDLKLVDSNCFDAALEGRATDTVGNDYQPERAFLIWSNSNDSYGFAKFYLGGAYTALSGRVSVSDETGMSKDAVLSGKLQIYAEEPEGALSLLYESHLLTRATAPYDLPELDVVDAQWLEIRFYNEVTSWGLGVKAIVADAMLYKD